MRAAIRTRPAAVAALVAGALAVGLLAPLPVAGATAAITAGSAAVPATATSTIAAAAPGAPYPVGNAVTGYLQELLAPTSSPPGVNVWTCRPSAAHPDPVVLLPGTFYDLADTWQALGPMLANDGFCVFGLNYGATLATTLSGDRLWSEGDITTSAAQLAAFVTRVRSATGAAQVDIVGWSQGGMMPRWYLRHLGGAPFVHDLVALSPSNHGTTLDGLFALIDADTALGLPPPLDLAQCPACTQQQAGSTFLRQLNAPGPQTAGVRTTIIETRDDEVVTPYTSAFLAGPGITDVTLQDQCPNDHADHLAMPYDAAVLQDVVESLDGAPTLSVTCGAGLPVLGG